MIGYSVKPIKRHETLTWLKNIHYAKRIPMIMYAFGLYKDNVLRGVITYGKPPSKDLCICICGEKYKSEVTELNRLVLQYNEKNEASFLVSNSFKLLPKPLIIVSYADSNQNHNGYVYQATNFIYTGLSNERLKFIMGGKDLSERTLSGIQGNLTREQFFKKYNVKKSKQLGKHRYVYFLGNKSQKKERLKNLLLKQYSYPKGKNTNYNWDFKPETQGLLF
ncbi:hypothetical protein [uncultured Mediterranean phage uvDeep-CGR2-AD8-C175]|nr:hypothetical protein [uncultured Mediterranean phage uvDeep-CGR2-AD8-C175]